MLRVLNQYSHGYVFTPVVRSLDHGGVFRLLEQGPVALDELARTTGANPGPLFVALEMLLVLGWVERSQGLYAAAPEAAQRTRFPKDWEGLYSLPPLDLVSTPDGAAVLSRTLDRVAQGTDCEPPLSLLLEGPAMLSLLIGTAQGDLHSALASGDAREMPVAEAARKALVAKKWAKLDEDGFALNGVGKFMFGRAMTGGVTASYRPLLHGMPDLLFGDADKAMRCDGDGEGHVDRTLNVRSSGFQHEKYFVDLSKIIQSLFGDGEGQNLRAPAFVADMGCGDGSLLRRIHQAASEADSGESATCSSVMVGLDLNQAALDETARTLADIPHHLLTADVGDPQRLSRDFAALTNKDPGEILHVRSFLDHNRIYSAPLNPEQADLRPQLPSTGAGIGPGGSLVTPGMAHQNLVEHLGSWASILDKHGLLCLEVHAMSPWVKSASFDIAEGFHFDALHAFSRQYLCEPHIFLAATAEAGLFPEEHFLCYPRGMSYTRITLGYYLSKPWSIRYMTAADAAGLQGIKAEAGQPFDPEEAARFQAANPLDCFTIVDQEGALRGGLLCRVSEFDPETQTRTMALGQFTADAPEWGARLLRHALLYYGVQDGETVLESPLPAPLGQAFQSLAVPGLRLKGPEAD